MASHHRCCHHNAALYSSCCCATQCCYSPAPYAGCSHHHPATDPQLSCTAISQPPRPQRSHFYPVESHLPSLFHHQYQPQSRIQEHFVEEERQFHPTVSSLSRRISSLEFALRRCSPPPLSSSHSLRDGAARIIQAHFRAYLLRRSRTLRQLKDLASIKSTLKFLKSSVSEKTHCDYDLVYHKSLDLLLKLDSIQGSDPMIRDGRKSISRELNQFLNLFDAVYIERKELPSPMRRGEVDVRRKVIGSERRIGNVKHGTSRAMGVNVEKLRRLVAKIDNLAEVLDEAENESIESHNVFETRKHEGFSGKINGNLVRHGRSQHRAPKSVSFAENDKVYRVLKRGHEPILAEDCDDVIERGTLDEEKGLNYDDLCHDNKVIGISLQDAENENKEEQSESEGSLDSSNGERDAAVENSSSNRRFDESETKRDVYAAPLPMKMETRMDLLEKRRK